jgi:hypothetical protein
MEETAGSATDVPGSATAYYGGASRYDDDTWGKYNCLPAGHPSLTYQPPRTVVTVGMPLDYDTGVTKSYVEQHCSIGEAVDVFRARTAATGVRAKRPFDSLTRDAATYLHERGDDRSIPAHWGPWLVFKYQLGSPAAERPSETAANLACFRRYLVHCAAAVPEPAKARQLGIGANAAEANANQFRWDGTLAATTLTGSFTPCCFAGKLVAAAPLLALTTPTPVPTTFEITHSFTTSRTVTETTEEGFTVSGKVSVSGSTGKKKDAFYADIGGEVGASYSKSWTKTTADATTVQLGDRTVKEVKPGKNETQRLDLRACAGLYAGWLIYYPWKGDAGHDPIVPPKPGMRDAKFAAYPVLAPVHCGNLPTAAQEHLMTISAAR